MDEDGGAEAITAPVDIAAAKDDFDTLRKDIYDFGQGVDKNSDKLGNSPSGIALKFIYSGLDLKCNRMENAFKAGMEQLFGFVDKYLELIGAGVHPGCEIDVTFNRTLPSTRARPLPTAPHPRVSSRMRRSSKTIRGSRMQRKSLTD